MKIVSLITISETDLAVDRISTRPRSCSHSRVACGGEVDPHLTDVRRDEELLLCQLAGEAVVPLCPDGTVRFGDAGGSVLYAGDGID